MLQTAPKNVALVLHETKINATTILTGMLQPSTKDVTTDEMTCYKPMRQDMLQPARQMLQPVGRYVAKDVTKCREVSWTVLNPTRISM